ncbi:MAG: Polyphosphate kinase [Verrucomicrobia subdivision 3 bacterium]|nr:Polyphosphate kinase [Limisphaerales bacterium]MCS1415032.1 Polyphosphate kinase [Limisphaerales bacterium]
MFAPLFFVGKIGVESLGGRCDICKAFFIGSTQASMAGFESNHFINRELSWLEFNDRVLGEARDPSNPLLERLKFLGIVSLNLDEFFEVRVAGLKQQIESEITKRTPDGRMPSETFREVAARTRIMVASQYEVWRDDIRPALAAVGIYFSPVSELSQEDLSWIDEFYFDQVASVLTPLGIDPAHPFPDLLNKSLNVIVEIKVNHRGEQEHRLAIVQVPRILSRLVRLPREEGEQHFVFLEEVIFKHLEHLFPGTEILGHWCFRVTRNSELYIDEESAANLIKAVEKELFNRRKGAAVRLEIEASCPEAMRTKLMGYLGLSDTDVYGIDGPIDPIPLMAVCGGDHPPELKDEPFVAPVASALDGCSDIFKLLRERDVLLHHPYEKFSSVIEFIEKAADDPRVLAIKQTLYRSGSDQRIFNALARAARKGKQVTVVVELKARFDENNNIRSARKLEEEGVHVLYGMVGYKIHSKMWLVVRRDDDRIRRYVHLGTGNYNPTTARIYTDLGLLSAREELGEDVGSLFNLLTGICQFQPMKKLLVAPFSLFQKMLELVDAETANARKGLPARIIAKMNALVDRKMIEALYRASKAGVEVQLIVRGVCCLRPGVPGLSERIVVRSIVGRFLEHSRIFYFENGCQPKVYIGSADWMPRNFFNRIETVFPIEDGVLRDRIINEVVAGNLADNTKCRLLQADGNYIRPEIADGQRRIDCQRKFAHLSDDNNSDSTPQGIEGLASILMEARREPLQS